MKALLVLLLFFFQSPTPTPVSTGKAIVVIVHSGNDSVGTAFVYALKEEIFKSSRYTLQWDQYDTKRPMLRVEIVSLDQGIPPQGYASSISVIVKAQAPVGQRCAVITSHLLLNVGSSKTEMMARNAISSIDDDLEKATE